ncbi:MAG: hypothetical protein ACRD2W_17565 [Acidimicrobiales bacterium]
MRRWIAGVLAVVALAVGTVACGSEDDGGVVETPGTTVGNSPGTTRASDYSG